MKSLFFLLVSLVSLPLSQQAQVHYDERDTPVSVPPLVNFQVHQPPVHPPLPNGCTIELIRHNFANSYYQYALHDYVPPKDKKCGEVGQWAAISLNYTVTSNGTQYDRLGAVTLDNVEIWRTSTAEPTKTGIIWTALKDVSRYVPLFSKPGKLVVDLNNVIDTSIGINGEYFVTLSVTFYPSTLLHPPAKRASQVISLSQTNTSEPGYVGIPPVINAKVKLPANTAAAYAEIYASGNAQEEFWYFNVPDQFLGDLPPDTTYGKGPFREVRLLVDGKLAGVVFPYPVIYTGGILPTLWRPISAYGSFDSPTYNVDLTPFVPVLADGQEHTITLDVVSSEPGHEINSNWLISGNIQVLLDESNKPTTGQITKYSVPDYAVANESKNASSNGDLAFTVTAKRDLVIQAEIITGSGKRTLVVWEQHLSFSNVQQYLDGASYQTVRQLSSGSTTSRHNSIKVLQDTFSYPLDIDFFNVVDNGNPGYSTTVKHSYDRTDVPSPLVVGSIIKTTQSSNGTLITLPAGRTANGTNTQAFSFTDLAGNTYTRSVSATNSNVTYSREGGTLSFDWHWPWPFVTHENSGTHTGFVGRLLGDRRTGKADIW